MFHRLCNLQAFQWDMAHCASCNSVVTKKDYSCYVCGEAIPQYASTIAKKKRFSTLSNVLFFASLGFSGYCFFSEHKLSLTVSLAISGSLFLLRIIAERPAGQESEDTARG